MKKIRSAMFLAVFAALLVVTAALAGAFNNGNFEAGDLSGWTVDISNKTGGVYTIPAPATYHLKSPQAASTLKTYAIDAVWATTNLGVSKCDPNTDGVVCLPHTGSWSAVVNYLGNQTNLNILKQTGPNLLSSDIGADGKYHIYFSYAPVLNSGGHPVDSITGYSDQPFMHVKLIRSRTGSADKVIFEKFSFPTDGNPNWSIPGSAGHPSGNPYYYMSWQTYDLAYDISEVTAGDSLSLEVAAAGCAATAHAGYVYVDDFGTTLPGGSTAPSITSLTPTYGPVAGGTSVTISGTGFTGATAVTVDTTTILAGSFTVGGDGTTITFNTPVHVAGLVDVSVTNTGGSTVLPASFTYYEMPIITGGASGGGTAPNSGPVTGGTSVVITGTGLVGGTFTFGGTSADCVANYAGTQATCTSPAHTAGLVDVVVINPVGSSTSEGGFTYYEVPTITNGGAGGGVSPNSGPIVGGQTVKITGTFLNDFTSVKFGDNEGVSCTLSVANTEITCTTPSHAAGSVDVLVTTPTGTATSVHGYTYVNAVLTVTASGPATVYPGGQYTYSFAYTTTASTSNAEVAFSLPGHTTYASNTGGYSCTPAAGVVTCTLGTITAPGSFAVAVNVDKLKKINTPLTLAATSYSISATGVPIVNGTAAVTANTLTPFTDVPVGYWALDHVQSIWAYGITYGCELAAPLTVYCPEKDITRGEMAVFIERAVHTSAFNPGTPSITFTDTNSHFAKYWIEALKSDGITSGCGTIATFCPDANIARVEMSVFLLRGRSWPSVHVPPASTGMWPDVSPSHWGVKWADELGTSGISSGCGAGNFCPNNPVLRSEMAVLVQRTFNLTMPTP